MILPEFEYLAPRSLGEACRLAKEYGAQARVMAGGTDLIVAMKENVLSPAYVIDLKGISGLDFLHYDEQEGLRIGALTKLRAIEKSELVKMKLKAVSDAAHYVASTQVRAKGTMAGNIVNASPSADTAPILLAMRAKVGVAGTEGRRVIPMEDCYAGFKKTSLLPGEIVTEIAVPPLRKNQRAAYIKHAVRKAMDLAIVGAAAVVTVEDGICSEARITLGAVAATVLESRAAEAELVGRPLTDDVIARAAEAAMDECSPISDVRASAEYRRDMVRVFTKRAIKKALGEL